MNIFNESFHLTQFTSIQRTIISGNIALTEALEDIPGKLYLYPLFAVDQMCAEAGHLRTLRTNMHTLLNTTVSLMNNIQERNETLKLAPTFQVDIQDYGSIHGLYVYPQDIIGINVWNILDNLEETIKSTLLHEITHWYTANMYQDYSHGLLFKESYSLLWGKEEEPHKQKSRRRIVSNIEDQAYNCNRLQRIMRD